VKEPRKPPIRASRQCPTFKWWASISRTCPSRIPESANAISDRPQIELAVDLNAARMAEKDMFEVELKIRVDAKPKAARCSLLEVAYAGAFRLTNVPDTAPSR